MVFEASSFFDQAKLRERLQSLDPIDALSPGRLDELSRLCVVETARIGEDPFRLRGIEGQSVYLLQGELKVRHDNGSSSVYVGGTEAAREPLGKRSGGVRDGKAITPVALVRVDDDVLDIMMTWDQLSAAPDKAAGGADWRQMTGAFRVESLTYGALSRLPAASIDTLFKRFERIRVRSGERVVKEGDDGDFYYIIESGCCEVSRKIGGDDMPLADLKAGDAFGEEALVAEGKRNATVTANRDGVLLRLGKKDFIELLREPLLKRLAWVEAERQVASGAAWLDVRYPSEYQRDRLPGAINVPLGEIRNAIGLLDRDREYVVYCQSGRRSSAAAFLLSQHGYRAACLEGGLLARHAGERQ